MKNNILRIVPFFSGGASAALYLIQNDPAYGKEYVFPYAVTDKPDASGSSLLRDAGVPVHVFDYAELCNRERIDPKDLQKRDAYFQEIAHFLSQRDRISPIDYILCAGFMLKITPSLLNAYSGKILNVHPADLRIIQHTHSFTIRKPTRLFTGAKAVHRAYDAHEEVMRSTVHFVTAEIDAGPIIALSDPYTVDYTLTPEQVQNEMKNKCDGPAYIRALQTILLAA